MNNLGSKISLKRKAIGLTQAELAERMNVTRQTVNRWEAGSVLPDIEKIADIANILGTSCDYLLKDESKDLNLEDIVLDEFRLAISASQFKKIIARGAILPIFAISLFLIVLFLRRK